MAVTVVEFSHGAISDGSNSLATATISATPQPGDVALLLWRSHRISWRTLASANGLGGTWSILPGYTGGAVNAAICTNPTTAGTVQSVASNVGVSSISVLLIRGLTGTTWTAGSTTYPPGPVNAGYGQIAVSWWMTVQGSATTSAAWDDPDPDTGWTLPSPMLAVSVAKADGYRIPGGAAEPHTTRFIANAGAAKVGTVAVLGDLGTPPTTGTLAAVAPSPVAALAGDVTDPAVTGTLAAVAPSPVAALAGDVLTPVPGTLAAVAPSPVAALAGTVTVTGTLAALAPSPVAALAGGVSYPGTIAAAAPMPRARLLAWGDPVTPRELLHRLLTIALPSGPGGIDLVPYARDVDPPARPTLLLRIDDVTRHPDAQQTQRRYGFSLILLGAGEGDAAESDLETALEDVLWAVESSPDLPQWTRAERAVWRDTTPAFEVAVPVDFSITDPDTITPA